MRRGRPKNWIFSRVRCRWGCRCSNGETDPAFFLRISRPLRYLCVTMRTNRPNGDESHRNFRISISRHLQHHFLNLHLFPHDRMHLNINYIASRRIYSYRKKVSSRDKWFSRFPFVTVNHAKNNDDLVPALIDGANSLPLRDYRAIKRHVTYKRHRRNREITVRRGSLVVFSILDTVEFPLPNKTRNLTWGRSHT